MLLQTNEESNNKVQFRNFRLRDSLLLIISTKRLRLHSEIASTGIKFFLNVYTYEGVSDDARAKDDDVQADEHHFVGVDGDPTAVEFVVGFVEAQLVEAE